VAAHPNHDTKRNFINIQAMAKVIIIIGFSTQQTYYYRLKETC